MGGRNDDAGLCRLIVMRCRACVKMRVGSEFLAVALLAGVKCDVCSNMSGAFGSKRRDLCTSSKLRLHYVMLSPGQHGAPCPIFDCAHDPPRYKRLLAAGCGGVVLTASHRSSTPLPRRVPPLTSSHASSRGRVDLKCLPLNIASDTLCSPL